MLEISIEISRVPVLVAGELNAKLREWRRPFNDARGTLLASALDIVCNKVHLLMFVHISSEMYIDTLRLLASFS